MLIVLDNNENWSQTETHILLKFSNISHHTHASDFNGCDNYIKINLNPYIYECFFDQPIKFDSIVTHIERDFISCTFEKIDNVIWTNFSKTFECN
ncbi:hypothetical protein A3Q56_07379 [Intoshia linei]|uniref:Uncharacterized protein n=1 Tax=Intoshia linei TaxID=1819745 RepID=A0A177AU61_9BILA|nr:hypothetical protein A3Q56_07379 [Intoshia linei]